MESVPDLPLLRIFSHVPVPELVRVIPRVCRRWNHLSRSAPDIRLTFGGSKVSKEGVRRHLHGSLARFRNVTRINLDGCTFMRDADVAQIFAKTPGLEVVSLQALRITDLALLSLATHCPHLVEVDIGATSVTNRGVNILVSRCPKLVRLDVPMCLNLTDAIADALVSMPALTSLDISTCRRLTDVFFTRFALAGPGLVRLKMCHLRRVTNVGMVAMIHGVGRRLRTLEMSNCFELGDASVAAIGDVCRELTDLTMTEGVGHGILTDVGVSALVHGCPRLTQLDLSHCYAITMASVADVLRYCDNLDALLLECCFQLSDATMPPDVVRCRRLRSASFRGCHQITGPLILGLVTGCPNLERLDVAGCMLTRPAKILTAVSGLHKLRVFVYCRGDPVSIPVRP